MKQTFFESMGIAGLEKIHTQFIEWVLNNDMIASKVKFLLLQDFTGKTLQPLSDNDKIYAMTEFESIDLIVRMGNNLVILENKLASSQHDNQLKRYEQVVLNCRQEKNIFFETPCNPNIFYVLLELIEEKPESDKWSCVSYSKWCDIICKFKEECSTSKINDVVIGEYIKTLRKMTEAVQAALDSPQNHKKIFESKPKKFIKYSYLQKGIYYDTDTEKYIAMQNMETIVQKAFLYKLVRSMKVNNRIKIDNSRGIGLLEFKYHILKSRNGEEYFIGIQFQKKSGKIIYRHLDDKKYNSSSLNDVPISVKKFFKEISSCSNGSVNGGTSNEWYAISYKLPNYYYELSFDESLKMYQDKYDEFTSLIDKYVHVLDDNPDWHET